MGIISLVIFNPHQLGYIRPATMVGRISGCDLSIESWGKNMEELGLDTLTLVGVGQEDMNEGCFLGGMLLVLSL
jgi:hypothetical protein